MSRSQLEESNKISFTIFGATHDFLWILQVCRKTKPNKTLAKSLGAPPAGQPRRRQAWPTGQRATQPGQGEAGLDRSVGAAMASRARACAATASGGGAKRRNGAGPERERRGAHGDAEVAARLTSGGAGEERRRRSGTTALGGGGPRRSSPALQEGREGRVRAKIGG